MRITALFGILAVSAGLTLAQAASEATLVPTPTLAAGTRVNAELKSRLDTQHAKVGDKVTAVTTSDVKEHGIKVLPKGSTLTGHVTEVTAAESSKSPSRIGVLFDQALPKKGEPMALRAGIVSVLSSPANIPMDMGNMGAMPSGEVGGATHPPVNGDVGMDTATHGGTLGEQSVPDQVIAPNSEITSIARASNGSPIRIVMPAPSATASQQPTLGSVLSTPKGDLKLDSGTRLQLQIMH